MARRFTEVLRGAGKVLVRVRHGTSRGLLTHLVAGAAGAVLVLILAEASRSRPTPGPEIGEFSQRLGALEAAARQREEREPLG
jgi:hypothetical protein